MLNTWSLPFYPTLSPSPAPLTLTFMAIGTHKANTEAHPGCIILENQQARWTQKQIEEDEECAKVDAAKAKEEAAVKHHAVVTRIAKLHGSAEKEEAVICANTNRPDLWTHCSYKPFTGNTMSLTISLPHKKSTPGSEKE